ncbi:hypothetical protein F5Y18DRAFT_437221 [Xylariaceae sp. FL1019]|nr:hypothetical protein F5Y18DRAFT_437221 [Xylariaceae sp. FL1019]
MSITMRTTKAKRDSKIVKDLGLDWTSEQRDAYHKIEVKTVYLKRLDKPYPIDNSYTAGTETAKDQWEAYWHGKRLKDLRYHAGQRRGIVNLEKERLQYIIPQNESVIFRDADTKQLVLVILRNAVPSESLRKTMVETCKEILRNRRTDRREDPGQLVHFGYTSGSRCDRQIQMAAPSIRLNTAAKIRTEAQLNIKSQGMAGIVWNLMKSKLPTEIIDNFNDMIEKCDFPRMDMGRDDETFTFNVDGKDVTFEGLELPSPNGLSSINYARHTHMEVNGNDWVLAYSANAPANPNKGGNFYVASYGIMLEPASNTISAWRPTDHHGTTLYEMMEGPEHRAGYEVRTDGAFNTGMVFQLSKAFATAREKSIWLDNRRKLEGKTKKEGKRKPVRPRSKPKKERRYELRSGGVKPKVCCDEMLKELCTYVA